MTGSDPILNGIYPAEPGSFISMCAVAVIRAGYRLFAVENNDTCSAIATTPQKIKILEESKKCGLEHTNAFQFYTIKGNFKERINPDKLSVTSIFYRAPSGRGAERQKNWFIPPH